MHLLGNTWKTIRKNGCGKENDWTKTYEECQEFWPIRRCHLDKILSTVSLWSSQTRTRILRLFRTVTRAFLMTERFVNRDLLICKGDLFFRSICPNSSLLEISMEGRFFKQPVFWRIFSIRKMRRRIFSNLFFWRILIRLRNSRKVRFSVYLWI